MGKNIIVFFLLGSLLYPLLGDSANDEIKSASIKFVNKIRSEKIKLSKKLLLIEFFQKHGLNLSGDGVLSLLDYLNFQTMDERLFKSIIELLKNADLREIDLIKAKKTIIAIVDKTTDSIIINDLLYILSKAYSFSPSEIGEFYKKDFPVFVLQAMKKNKLFFFSALKNGKFRPENSEHFNFIIKQLNDASMSDSDKIIILEYISRSCIPYVFKSKEFDVLINLTKHKKHEIASSAVLIINGITHNNRVKNWVQWRVDNPNYSILENAVTVLLNSSCNYTISQQHIAALQISMFFLIKGKNCDINLWNRMYNGLIASAGDVKKQQMLYSILRDIVDHTTEPKKSTKEFYDITKKLIQDARFHILILGSLGDRVNNDFYKVKVQSILLNSSMNPLSRGFAAYALGFSKHDKKHIAQAIYIFIQSRIKHKTRPVKLALIGLKNLVGKDYSTNLLAWKKAIDAMPDDEVSVKEKKQESQPPTDVAP